MARGEQFIFVGGSGRSGTTLLQNILDSHPDIIGGPEFRDIPYIIDLRKKLHYSLTTGRTVVFNNSHEEIDNYITTLIENLLMPLLRKNNRKFLSEKTPANILVFPELLKLFPEAHFIFMIRDPRPTILSHMKARVKMKSEKSQASGKNQLSGFEFLEVTSMVKRHILAGLSASRIAPEKVLTVIYERLVADPESETKTLCNFLGVEWSSQLLHPSRKEHIGEEAMTVVRKSFYTKESFNRDPDPTGVNKWESELTFFEKAIILFCFRDLKNLVHYGYDLTAKSLPEKALLKTFLYYAKLSNTTRMFSIFLEPFKKLKVFTKC